MAQQQQWWRMTRPFACTACGTALPLGVTENDVWPYNPAQPYSARDVYLVDTVRKTMSIYCQACPTCEARDLHLSVPIVPMRVFTAFSRGNVPTNLNEEEH